VFKNNIEKRIRSLPEIDGLSKETVLSSWMAKFDQIFPDTQASHTVKFDQIFSDAQAFHTAKFDLIFSDTQASHAAKFDLIFSDTQASHTAKFDQIFRGDDDPRKRPQRQSAATSEMILFIPSARKRRPILHQQSWSRSSTLTWPSVSVRNASVSGSYTYD